MKIKGANLGEIEAEVKKLTDFDWTDNIELNNLIKYIEDMYISNFRNNNINIAPFSCDDNGKVIISPGLPNHKCSDDLDVLRTISKYGILASEWFGALESEKEGRFCVFISKTKNKDYKFKGDLGEDDFSRLNSGKNLILFFDYTNPVFQKLIHLDYFEYEKNKKTNPVGLKEIYSQEEIALFDKLIEPLSPGGIHMRNEYDFKTNYWSAIPGGIPPFLINGICIKNNNYTSGEIQIIADLFPNATIFRGNLDIVHLPTKTEEKENLKKI